MFSLSYLTDEISTDFDSGLLTGMILIDLRKAFGTINYELLVEKMSSLGFSNHSIKWFKSYLSNRSFPVSTKNKHSSIAKINFGIPQGSILGLLLFSLYVNDMNQAADCDLFLNADGTCLVYQHKNVSKTNQNLSNFFLLSICDWFVDNKLSIHLEEDKTKGIPFGTNYKFAKVGSLDIRYTIHINPNLGGLLRDWLCSGGGELHPCLKLVKIMLEIRNVIHKYTYI